MASTHAIRLHAHGGPEVMRWEEVPLPEPGPGEVLVRHEAVGFNFTDVNHRRGEHPEPTVFPVGIGQEAAGTVEALGAGVTAFRIGEPVAYATRPAGSYAERRVMPADRLVALPDHIDTVTAAGSLLKGMTVEYLTHRAYRVQPGDVVLLHAAAGGVGLIACQWLRHLGATVIGTVSTADKAALAAAHGCHHTILYTREDVAGRVRDLTGGRGAQVVYDSVGRTTFEASLAALAPRGHFVGFGAASGPIPPFAPGRLGALGSLNMTWTRLPHFTGTRPELLASAQAFFDVVRQGIVRPHVSQRRPLHEAAAVHRDAETRLTSGSVVMLP
ncbi:MAG: quinone oxidoreductase [Alphaproteobacteria bacterium]